MTVVGEFRVSSTSWHKVMVTGVAGDRPEVELTSKG